MDPQAADRRDRARRADVERFLYAGARGDRFTQRSPITLDVWTRFAVDGPGPHDLLLIANRDSTAGELVSRLEQGLRADAITSRADGDPDDIVDRAGIVATPAAVAARLTFAQLIRVALPLTQWWRDYLYPRIDRPDGEPRTAAGDPAALFATAPRAPGTAQAMIDALAGQPSTMSGHPVRDDLLWLARAAGGIAHLHSITPAWPPSEAKWRRWIEERERGPVVVEALFRLMRDVAASGASCPLWAVHCNRPAELAMRRSMNTIKADAARHVFDVTGKGIRWAVLDSGIDATHVAFRRRTARGPCKLPPSDAREDWSERTRVTRTYDFTHLRELMALSPRQLDRYPEGVPANLRDRLADPDDRARLRAVLADTGQRDRSATRSVIDWERWLPLLRVDHVAGRYRVPRHPHGTHVAGILAADWRVDDLPEDPVAPETDVPSRRVARTGVCPELELWDVRVLDEAGASDEFSILAALQFVRASNSRHEYQEVHGVNLSFSLLHDVSSYACGGTPVCVECERLVASGVVVVAAAGNHGRARYVGAGGEVDEGYRTISITDPGNASGVITVGATHRFEPHSYGVSYFSSRGPTGDGRAKPDLVAPGEKVTSTAPGDSELSLDGTSVAAPHVSGAAALLLCRYPELRGRPAELKRILCATATDLGRDRYCQGAGLVDTLRAMESI